MIFYTYNIILLHYIERLLKLFLKIRRILESSICSEEIKRAIGHRTSFKINLWRSGKLSLYQMTDDEISSFIRLYEKKRDELINCDKKVNVSRGTSFAQFMNQVKEYKKRHLSIEK